MAFRMASLRLCTLVATLALSVSFAFGPSAFGATSTKKKNSKKTEPIAEKSLREQALTEAVSVGKAKKQASDVQVSAEILSLKDPRPEIPTRSWNYFVALSAQQFQAEGTGQGDLASFDLGQNGQTVMPGIEFGVLSQDLRTESVIWNVGVKFKGAFASQAATAVLPSGFVIDDARLNTTLLSVGPTVNVRWERFNWLAFTFTPEFGSLNYTQTSSNDYGKFSKTTGFKSLAAGLDFRVGEKVSVFTEYAQRDSNDSQIALQKDNFELGTKITW